MWITFIPDAENIQKSTDRIILSDCYTERFIYQSGVFFLSGYSMEKRYRIEMESEKTGCRLQSSTGLLFMFFNTFLYCL